MIDRLKEVWGKIKENTFTLGIVSLLWLLFRTGTKPSRIVYPCQQAAAENAYVLLSSILPFLAATPKKTVRFFTLKGRIALALSLAILVVGAGVAVWWAVQQREKISTGQVVRLTLDSRLARGTESPSNIFVVQGTTGWDDGLGELIKLMGSHGLLFYKSEVMGSAQGPSGLIAHDDVVLIKVNAQWSERGGTNTDLLKKLIEKIVNHPDGFIGEIVVADNGQGRGGLSWSNSNAEDHSQSTQKVVDLFSGSYKVSTFLWDKIREKRVDEYSSGDVDDGYVVSPMADPQTGIRPSYPKFRTAYGTYISFKEGIWNPVTKSYDSKRLKVINAPVLKSHSTYGVTASVKNYMGVVSQPLTNAHSAVGQGGMGTEMVETRFPTLNILDAIWVNAKPLDGPATSYEEASRVNVILASTDPIALDYWAVKHVLLQTAILKGEENTGLLDPDNPDRGSLAESFHVWLERSMEKMQAGGYQVTMNEDHMNVYVVNFT